jgi:hypothetical protein
MLQSGGISAYPRCQRSLSGYTDATFGAIDAGVGTKRTPLDSWGQLLWQGQPAPWQPPSHIPMLERQLLLNPIAKDFRCSTCGWVWTIPPWIAADFSYARALGDAFKRHECGEHPLALKA